MNSVADDLRRIANAADGSSEGAKAALIVAAAEIERLTKDRDEAVALFDECAIGCKSFEAAEAELDATVRKFNCDDADQFWRNISILRTSAETAERLLAEATGALEPFAEFCGEDTFWSDDAPDDYVWLVHDSLMLTVGDMRRARTTLSSIRGHNG